MSTSEKRPTTTAVPLEGEHTTIDSPDRPTINFHPTLPSDTVAPTEVSTPPQQAATQPGAGGVQHTQVVVQPPQPTFNQKVVGYAKEIRGTILHKPETKELGGRIRKGEEPWPPSPEKATGGSFPPDDPSQ